MSLVAVCSGKNAPGATFVSINLAAALAGLGEEVALLDLDPSGGDIAAYLGLDPRRGLYPLVRLEGSIPSFDALLREAETRSAVRCVGGFPRADDADLETISQAIAAARSDDRTVIADIGRISPDTAALPADADLVLVVLGTDIVAVFGAERAIDLLTRSDVNPARTRAVVSGWQRRRPSELREASHALRVEMLGAIPLDLRGARRSLLAQTPLACGRAARAFRSLAAEVRRILAPAPELEEMAQ